MTAQSAALIEATSGASTGQRMTILVNGTHESAAGIRARSFARCLKDKHTVHIVYRSDRKVISILRFWSVLRQTKPSVTYVIDMAYSGVIAAFLHKWTAGNRLIIDTGDSIYQLARLSRSRAFIGLFLTKVLETVSLFSADRLIVRGTFHKSLLRGKGRMRVDVIQDGVEPTLFRPMDCAALRAQYGLDKVITVGFVGTLTWNSRARTCYGSELIEALALLRGLPVKGVIIGDGSGLEELRQRARELGVEHQVLFLGRIPYLELPRFLNLIDICLSTQTNDEIGQVRTTGKLPLYLACGRYVLATKVGEASLVLPEEMLVEYYGSLDSSYPARLANRIRSLIVNPQKLQNTQICRRLSEQTFAYSVLAGKLAAVLAGASNTQ